MEAIEHGKAGIEYKEDISMNPKTWIQEVQDMLAKRELKIINSEEKEPNITYNKIIMDYAEDYIQGRKVKKQGIDEINHIRLRKKTYLPFELLGLDRIT